MSAHEHRAQAGSGPLQVAVVTVSSTRSAGTDGSGDLIASKVEAAGHTVGHRSVIGDDIETIRNTVREIGLAGTQVALFTGGTGVSARDVTPEALGSLFTKPLPGFGEVFRVLSFHKIGAAAMLSRATAGMVGGMAVFALPGSTKACELALDELILSEMGHLVSQATKEGIVEPPVAETPDEPSEDEAGEGDDEPLVPPPTGSFGSLGGQPMSISVAAADEAKPPAFEKEEMPASGWKRAVFDLKGTVHFDQRQDLPDALHKLAPVLEILRTAGEFAVLELEGGRRYAIYGWPDLRRPNSKVLAVGPGEPLAEVLALHRHPVMTGTCIESPKGQLPDRWQEVSEVCEQVTGRAPKKTNGELFALNGDTVWIQRGIRIVKWDGSNEKEDGNFKQSFNSLLMDWHSR